MVVIERYQEITKQIVQAQETLKLAEAQLLKVWNQGQIHLHKTTQQMLNDAQVSLDQSLCVLEQASLAAEGEK